MLLENAFMMRKRSTAAASSIMTRSSLTSDIDQSTHTDTRLSKILEYLRINDGIAPLHPSRYTNTATLLDESATR